MRNPNLLSPQPTLICTIKSKIILLSVLADIGVQLVLMDLLQEQHLGLSDVRNSRTYNRKSSLVEKGRFASPQLRRTETKTTHNWDLRRMWEAVRRKSQKSLQQVRGICVAPSSHATQINNVRRM